MDASNTDSLQVPWDNSEEHSDLKTTKWEGKMKNIAVCVFFVFWGMEIMSYTGWINAEIPFKRIQKFKKYMHFMLK